MNRAQRRLLRRANGDPDRAMLIAQGRSLSGANASEASSLARAMADEADERRMDAVEDALIEYGTELES